MKSFLLLKHDETFLTELFSITESTLPGGQNDDLRPSGSDPDLHTGVPILGKLSGQELVQLGFKDAVWDKLGAKKHGH